MCAALRGGDFTSFYNQSEGSTIVRAAHPLPTSIAGFACFDNDFNSATTRCYLLAGSGSRTIQYLISNTTANIISNDVKDTLPHNHCGSYKLDDIVAVFDGTIIGTDSSCTPRSVTKLTIGNRGAATAPLNGHIARIQYFRKRLPNAKLETLTQFVSDPDANAYIVSLLSAGATVTPTQQGAINTFVKTGKADGWYSSLKRLYLPIWAAAAPNAIDMIGLTSGTFNGTVTHGAGFVEGDGSTGYFDIGVAPTALTGVSTASAYTFGLLLDTLDGGQAIGRSRNSVNQDWNLSTSAGNFFSGIMRNILNFGLLSVAITRNGILSGSRVDGTRFIAQRVSASRTNHVSVTDDDHGSVPTLNYYFLAGNVAGVTAGFTTARAGSYGLGLGLTDAQDAAFTANLKTLWETCTGLSLP